MPSDLGIVHDRGMTGARSPLMARIELIDTGFYFVVSCALVEMICAAPRLEPSSVTWMLLSLLLVSEHFPP